MCFLTEIMTPAGNNETLSSSLDIGESFFISCLVKLARGNFWLISDEAGKYTSCQLHTACLIGRGSSSSAKSAGFHRRHRSDLARIVCAISCVHVNLKSNNFLHQHGGDWTVTQREGRVGKTCVWKSHKREACVRTRCRKKVAWKLFSDLFTWTWMALQVCKAATRLVSEIETLSQHQISRLDFERRRLTFGRDKRRTFECMHLERKQKVPAHSALPRRNTLYYIHLGEGCCWEISSENSQKWPF